MVQLFSVITERSKLECNLPGWVIMDFFQMHICECYISAFQFYSASVMSNQSILLCMPGQSVVHKSGSKCH